MRYFKGAEAKVVSAFNALPLDAMKDMIDKRQAMKDKADDNYSILKASLEADVSPVDQPRYLAIKQSFYSAIDELSNSNLSPEQSARVAVALNTQLRNEMTNGFTAQAIGNKQRILEHREELRKKAKDLNLNHNEIEHYIKTGENEFIQGGGSIDPERGVFRNYEGLNPVKRTDYLDRMYKFADKVKTSTWQEANKWFKQNGLEGVQFSNDTEFAGFKADDRRLYDAAVAAITRSPEDLAALSQDVGVFGYHRDLSPSGNVREVLSGMAISVYSDLFHNTTRLKEGQTPINLGANLRHSMAQQKIKEEEAKTYPVAVIMGEGVSNPIDFSDLTKFIELNGTSFKSYNSAVESLENSASKGDSASIELLGKLAKFEDLSQTYKDLSSKIGVKKADQDFTKVLLAMGIKNPAPITKSILYGKTNKAIDNLVIGLRSYSSNPEILRPSIGYNNELPQIGTNEYQQRLGISNYFSDPNTKAISLSGDRDGSIANGVFSYQAPTVPYTPVTVDNRNSLSIYVAQNQHNLGQVIKNKLIPKNKAYQGDGIVFIPQYDTEHAGVNSELGVFSLPVKVKIQDDKGKLIGYEEINHVFNPSSTTNVGQSSIIGKEASSGLNRVFGINPKQTGSGPGVLHDVFTTVEKGKRKGESLSPATQEYMNFLQYDNQDIITPEKDN